jgi:hypothetical protein
MATSNQTVEGAELPTYAISVRRMTAESVAYVLAAGAIAITGLVVAAMISPLLGLMIMLGAIPLWGWGCLAGKTFYKEG